jgi:hypothetical protein
MRAPNCEQPEAETETSVVAGRYHLVRELGRGGVASVHEARDAVTGRRIALKRILARGDTLDNRRALELFEREFHTLAQLVHPRIVEVYDYALDDAGPFYTMELLDGGDLQHLVPVEWRRACALARDVCSALSLLHSRRFVHRDVSTRNVRCTSDGLAKLIDFGAMLPMGPSKVIIGTPPYVSPEALDMMSLDARTDIYALGATLYYALTGRHAFPARTFQDLRERWQSSPVPPSSLARDVPPALDALVLDLLQLDPSGRPATAAEVIERLSAIEGVVPSEHSLVAQAYLSTPVLVGRDADLGRIRNRIRRAQDGRGGAVLVTGASGVGRSRLLDACALDAKLEGSVVLRGAADDGLEGDFSCVRALARAAIAAMPVQALEAGQTYTATLGSLVPELVDPDGAPQSTAVSLSGRAAVQAALRDWFLALARARPLFIAVDDIHRLDEPSLAWLALLSNDVGQNAIVVVATADHEAKAASTIALEMFSENASQLALQCLSAAHTEQLLVSVFGDVPNVRFVADRIHGISAGNPRDTLSLAQHLLDRGRVRYAAGAWTLPSHFDASDLPSSMAHALLFRVEELSTGARELGRAVSLSPGLSVTFEECRALSGRADALRLMEAVHELVRAEILRKAGDQYELSQRAWAAAFAHGLGEEQGRELHLRLARVFERRPGQEFRVGQHLMFAGEPARGIEVLVRQSEALEDVARRSPEEFFNFIRSLPPDWFETYDEAIALSAKLERPRREAYLLRCRIAALVSVGGTTDRIHVPALIAELCAASGLTDWAALEGLDPKARLMTAMGKARARYEATPERDRVLDPGSAVRQLARVLIQGSAVLTSALDIAGSQSLPSLAPLVPLSPALGVIEELIKGMIARMTGRAEVAQAHYAKVLARTGEPDRAGLDESHHVNMRLGLMSGLGMIEAAMGRDSSLGWAEKVEVEPLYQVNAVHIRMLHHLWQGNTREAVRCQKQVDLLRIQGSARQFFEGTHLIWQIVAYASSADLTRTKQTIDEIDTLCRRYPGWIPVRHYGLGEYHRIRGDLGAAIAELEKGLLLVRPGEHQIWVYLAGAYLRALHDSGRDADALALGESHAAACEAAGLGYTKNYVAMPLALIRARLGHAEAAKATADQVISDFRAQGATGINLGLAYEVRARVASLLGDTDDFDLFSSLFATTFDNAANPALASKCQKLRRDQRRRGDARMTEFPVSSMEGDLASSRALSMLATCHNSAERAECMLRSLVEASGAQEGYLFLLTDDGPACRAKTGTAMHTTDVDDLARRYLADHLQDVNTETGGESGTGAHADFDGMRFVPVLLSHAMPNGFAITGVAFLSSTSGTPSIAPSALATALSRRVEMSGDGIAAVVDGWAS